MARLDEYERKRRFEVTPEPRGAKRPPKKRRGLQFVVQKHAATRLHYDFRLEWAGTLLSWAVPKGPCPDPDVKRLAMEVEDHPIEYAAFEGIIPAGEYGGGTVMVWDAGTYEPDEPDVGESHRAGRLGFTLDGRKLQGRWMLVRTGKGESRSWLLFKRRDEGAVDADLLEREPRSLVSDRLMAEIAFDEGGDVERAARADPPDAIRALIKEPATKKRKPRKKPSVWRSDRAKDSGRKTASSRTTASKRRTKIASAAPAKKTGSRQRKTRNARQS